MEDQVGARGLVVNALKQWQEAEEQLNPEDVACLSPLLHKYINMLGRYEFPG